MVPAGRPRRDARHPSHAGGADGHAALARRPARLRMPAYAGRKARRAAHRADGEQTDAYGRFIGRGKRISYRAPLNENNGDRSKTLPFSKQKKGVFRIINGKRPFSTYALHFFSTRLRRRGAGRSYRSRAVMENAKSASAGGAVSRIIPEPFKGSQRRALGELVRIFNGRRRLKPRPREAAAGRRRLAAPRERGRAACPLKRCKRPGRIPTARSHAPAPTQNPA